MNRACDDFAQYYYLETYLFGTVQKRFAATHTLSAFYFFCIVIWKSNRAKSKIAKLMLASKKYPSLEAAVAALMKRIYEATLDEDKMRVLVREWKFGLPMASALLTVLYPDVFTVYDVRVSDEIGRPKELKFATRFESLWKRYEDYRKRVRASGPADRPLRDQDRFLWGKSFAEQLHESIADRFPPKALKSNRGPWQN